MGPCFGRVTDVRRQADVLRAARCGRIEVADERLVDIRLRPWARSASRLEVALLGRAWHRWATGNRCRLYYHRPLRFPNFLVLSYVVSSRKTTLATFRGALRLLDEIARLKRTDALLCDVATAHITERLMARWGWSPLAPRRGHRPYVKRFYGNYPPHDALLASLLADPCVESSVCERPEPSVVAAAFHAPRGG